MAQLVEGYQEGPLDGPICLGHPGLEVCAWELDGHLLVQELVWHAKEHLGLRQRREIGEKSFGKHQSQEDEDGRLAEAAPQLLHYHRGVSSLGRAANRAFRSRLQMHRLVRHGLLRLRERHVEVHVSLLLILMIGGALRIWLLLDFLDLILFVINEGASEFRD